ncbi:MAG TPA: type II toxin-antitoxin system VapC family toxin [Gemmataceae bacterium]|nr:type II toxin-antitoxin system VapC family toxin [Gemmataceae bacterium]
MTFADLLGGDSVFLDANALVYHFEPHPAFGPACTHLLARIEKQELSGSVSTHVLTEIAHRLMMVEASRLPGSSMSKIKQRLQRRPALIQQLTEFRTALEEILQGRLQVLTIAPSLIVDAAQISQQIGLLSSDALLIAIMHAHGLTKLASNDADFDRVPGISRYSPA